MFISLSLPLWFSSYPRPYPVRLIYPGSMPFKCPLGGPPFQNICFDLLWFECFIEDFFLHLQQKERQRDPTKSKTLTNVKREAPIHKPNVPPMSDNKSQTWNNYQRKFVFYHIYNFICTFLIWKVVSSRPGEVAWKQIVCVLSYMGLFKTIL